jgi:CelD/BcsL family acetyltransferase involved in cellulose biosynthesis
MIESAIAQDGVKRFDYLTGNDPYKKEWMSQSRVLSTIAFANLHRPYGSLFFAREALAGSPPR